MTIVLCGAQNTCAMERVVIPDLDTVDEVSLGDVKHATQNQTGIALPDLGKIQEVDHEATKNRTHAETTIAIPDLDSVEEVKAHPAQSPERSVYSSAQPDSAVKKVAPSRTKKRSSVTHQQAASSSSSTIQKVGIAAVASTAIASAIYLWSSRKEAPVTETGRSQAPRSAQAPEHVTNKHVGENVTAPEHQEKELPGWVVNFLELGCTVCTCKPDKLEKSAWSPFIAIAKIESPYTLVKAPNFAALLSLEHKRTFATILELYTQEFYFARIKEILGSHEEWFAIGLRLLNKSTLIESPKFWQDEAKITISAKQKADLCYLIARTTSENIAGENFVKTLTQAL